MKVTASKYVNARINLPNTNQENPSYLEPGETIEVQGVCIGTVIDSNAIWYKDSEEHYYWSGGFSEKGFELQLFDLPLDLRQEDRIFQEGFLNSMLPDFLEKYDDDSFIAVTVEYAQNNEAAIIITFPKSFDDNKLIDIPNELIYKGYRVAVKVLNECEFSPDNDPDPYCDLDKPFVMGGTVENIKVRALGTRGLKLEYNSSTVILTCFHVACSELLKLKLSEYNQSAVRVQFPAKICSSKVDPSFGLVIEGKVGGFHDFAFLSVSSGNMFSGNLFEDEAPTKAYSGFDHSTLQEGDTVIAFGTISGKKTGKIKKIYSANAFTTVRYPGIESTRVYGMIETTKISVRGDSGAAVTDETNKVIGIVIGSLEESSLVMPFFRLTNRYTLKLIK